MELKQIQYMAEERGYRFEYPTRQKPASCRILRGDEIVFEFSLFVTDEMRETDITHLFTQLTLHRALEAERKEEVDVCRACYSRYLPLRKLQDIYPDWPYALSPQCDYCERQAKYHVHRSDWITFPLSETKE